jgi:hypothetical protein
MYLICIQISQLIADISANMARNRYCSANPERVVHGGKTASVKG